MLEGQEIRAETGPAQFRGEFLGYCALIEDHAADALERLVELGELKKAPHLFGQKFGALARHVHHPKLWLHPAHVDQVLGELSRLVALRGAICHALMEEATIEGHPGLTWRLPGDKDWRNRKSLTDQELAGLLSDLKHQTKRFRNQLLKQL
ncbi:MAG TPA: hypothetical protein VL100_11275 [Croceibacterium sp.]|nr:hypothetical protein [Croceibacterium sp.]